VAGEEFFHGAGILGDADGSPGGLVAGGVVNIGITFVFKKIHIGVVDAFAGVRFEDGVEGAEFPSGQILERARKETQPLCPGMAACR